MHILWLLLPYMLNIKEGACSGTVVEALLCSWKVACSIPDGVIGIFY